jgi:hypothetical protein
MIDIPSLWLPILLSGALVWITSLIVWAVLPYHRSDYKKIPDEGALRAALQPQDLPPGQYNVPHLVSRSEMGAPEGQAKFTAGPVAFLTVLPKRVPSPTKGLVISFAYYLLMSAVVAYVATRTLNAETPSYLVLQVTGTVAWLGYGTAVVTDAVWFGRPWKSVLKTLLDAFIFGLVTGGVFVWLWPG